MLATFIETSRPFSKNCFSHKIRLSLSQQNIDTKTFQNVRLQPYCTLQNWTVQEYIELFISWVNGLPTKLFRWVAQNGMYLVLVLVELKHYASSGRDLCWAGVSEDILLHLLTSSWLMQIVVKRWHTSKQNKSTIVMYDSMFPLLMLVFKRNKNMVAWVLSTIICVKVNFMLICLSLC